MGIYTDAEQLARKLRGRLQIDSLPQIDTFTGYGTAAGSQTIDNDLIDQILNQTESYINLVLSQIYVVPLTLSNSVTVDIMADITESICISKLLQVHFEGANPLTGAADVSGAAMDLRKHGETLLTAISAGHNMYTAVLPQPANRQYGAPEIQPLVLPGEVVLDSKARPDTVSRNYTMTGVRAAASDPQKRNRYFSDQDDCHNGLWPNGRTYNVEPDPRNCY
jgi:hypothetical protein